MFAKTVGENLLRIAETYAKAAGITLSQVSKKFLGRSDVLTRIIDGTYSPGSNQVDKILDDFKENWPARTAWPKMRPPPMSR